jgi:hypothetical protein
MVHDSHYSVAGHLSESRRYHGCRLRAPKCPRDLSRCKQTTGSGTLAHSLVQGVDPIALCWNQLSNRIPGSEPEFRTERLVCVEIVYEAED